MTFVQFTFTTPSETVYDFVTIDSNYTGGWYGFWLYRPMIVEGNKIAYFSEAPEDIQARIDAVNAQVADIVSDNRVTPAEKQQLYITMRDLGARHNTLLVEAERYGFSMTDGNVPIVKQAYANLTAVTNPLLANLTVTSDVNGANLRSLFQYYLDVSQNFEALVNYYKKQHAEAQAKRTETRIDARSLNANTYYPVTIRCVPTTPYRITLARPLNPDMGVPPWSTHSQGFSLICRWTTNGSGWGAIEIDRAVEQFEYSYASDLPAGNIGQIHTDSLEYIYLRGGSIYNIMVEGESGVEIILRETTLVTRPGTAYAQSLAPISSVTAPKTVSKVIDEILSDDVADPTEKQYLLSRRQEIQAEFPKHTASADAYGVSKASYVAAHAALDAALAPLFVNINVSTPVSGTSIRAKFESYYNTRAALLKAVTDKVNANAQTAANNALAKAVEVAAKTQFQTQIEGGLIYTALMKLVDVLTKAETAGISGQPGTGGALPAFWAGGTYAQALNNIAKIILRHNGSGQLAGGGIAWDELGNTSLNDVLINGVISSPFYLNPWMYVNGKPYLDLNRKNNILLTRTISGSGGTSNGYLPEDLKYNGMPINIAWRPGGIVGLNLRIFSTKIISSQKEVGFLDFVSGQDRLVQLIAVVEDSKLVWIVTGDRYIGKRNAPDEPGVLVAGRCASNGAVQKAWGPKKAAIYNGTTHINGYVERRSTGRYRVHHSIGHDGYIMNLTPEGFERLVPRYSNIQANYFDVEMNYPAGTTNEVYDCGFSYVLFGDN